ncbi:MAG: glycosyltransferase family 1 protein [Acidobacteriota bacterium]|nr:glycosyltransferase family 1 protein [Acidobacteriota bacterium]
MTQGAAGPASIGVVAYEMEGEPTGVGRYLEELLTALRGTSRTRDWRLRLFFKGDSFEHPLWTGEKAGGCTCEAVFDRRADAHPILWEQVRLPRILRRRPVDLLFSPGYSLPGGASRPSLVTIHDVSFEVLPGDFSFRERWRRRFLARRAARSATRVLTDTDRTAAELQRRYGVPEERIAVAPLGVAPRFAQAGQSPSRGTGARENLAGLGVRQPYLLVPGSILPRRRLDLVLAGLTRLLDEAVPAGVAAGAGDRSIEELQLVIAGANQLPRPDDLDRMIRSGGCADRVIRIGYVDDQALPELYAGAVGTIYVSEYEGYGLPPLESLAAGVPALVSDAPALLDLWPDYPLRCDRLDVDGVTDGLRKLLFDREARRVTEVQGPERVRSLTWARAAETFAIEVETAWRAAQGRRP